MSKNLEEIKRYLQVNTNLWDKVSKYLDSTEKVILALIEHTNFYKTLWRLQAITNCVLIMAICLLFYIILK